MRLSAKIRNTFFFLFVYRGVHWWSSQSINDKGARNDIKEAFAERRRLVNLKHRQNRKVKLRWELFVMFRKELSFVVTLLILNFVSPLPSNVEHVVFEKPLSPEKSKIIFLNSLSF